MFRVVGKGEGEEFDIGPYAIQGLDNRNPEQLPIGTRIKIDFEIVKEFENSYKAYPYPRINACDTEFYIPKEDVDI